MEPDSWDALASTFADPPAEYGPIDGYWWEAGRLDRDKLTWQLEELKDKGVAGTWFYARYHDGEPLGSDPAYFSDEWWEFTRFSVEEHKRLGLIYWFSNWTALQFEQRAIRQQRDSGESLLWGRRLVCHQAESVVGGTVRIRLTSADEAVDIAAYRSDGPALDYASRTELPVTVDSDEVEWTPPGPGWVLTVVAARRWDLDYLQPEVGKRWNDVVLGAYEEHLPGLFGNGVGAFGPDEMALVDGTAMYSPAVLDRMRSMCGYDPRPYLVGLFHDIGARTEQVRAHFRAAMTALLGENFYQATTRWLHDRGMRHVSLSQLNDDALTHTYHYGDFFRYLRSFDVPGNEDPFPTAPGERRLFRTKMSSSVARLYGNGRAVLCAHYATGWGHTLEENLAWTLESYAKGLNLYNRHLASYSLLGGWYEYVPPADHFYQPAWRYWKTFADYVRRLSFIMSQGQHRADVAMLYPLTTIHADWVDRRDHVPGDDAGADIGSERTLGDAMPREVFGAAAVRTSEALEELARAVYHAGVDFDFVDDESFERAEVADGVLVASGVEFRSIVLPPMTTIRRSTVEKIKEFHDSGGTVVAFGGVPTASVEGGRDDPVLLSALDQVFRSGSGRGVLLSGDSSHVPEVLSRTVELDVLASADGVFHTHQKAGDVDIYLLFNVRAEERELAFDVRATGRPEVWDPLTGEIRPVLRARAERGRTEVRLRMKPHEGIVLVLAPEPADTPTIVDDNVHDVVDVDMVSGGAVVTGFDPVGGRKHARVSYAGVEHVLVAEVAAPHPPVSIDQPWSFRLEPTMNNRWGDFRYPAADELIGAEARTFRYFEEEGTTPGQDLGWHEPGYDDSGWQEVTYSYGPYWLHAGPFGPGEEPSGLLERAQRGDPELDWEPHVFSTKFGSDRRPAQDGPLGWFRHLLGVSENFLVPDDEPPGTTKEDHSHYFYTTVVATDDGSYTLRVGHCPEHPELTGISVDDGLSSRVAAGTRAWVNGVEVLTSAGEQGTEVTADVHLHQGRNPVLLRIVHPAGGQLSNYAVILGSEPAAPDPHVPLLRWFRAPQKLGYDVKPEAAGRIGWYRFAAPPGLRRVHLRAYAESVEAWVDGEQCPVRDGVVSLSSVREGVSSVVLRIHQRPGAYAGAVFAEPVTFDCDQGRITLGDWCQAGLATYSGIGVYSTDVALSSAQVRHQVHLDLGDVKSLVEVFVNGQRAGVKISRPFVFDISDFVHEGHNHIEVKVANTLANHMSTYPTKWVFEGQTVSGLLGPVRLRFLAPVRLSAEP